jgi:hypothetical protein
MITEDDSLKDELAQTKQELLELREEVAQLKAQRKEIVHNGNKITIMQYVSLGSLIGLFLLAMSLSGITYERKTAEGELVSFKGADFKTTLLGITGIVVSSVGAVGFGDRFIKKAEEKE